MATVVQAKCPGCKQTLRIPANWVNQSMKCRHCGLVLHAKPRPAATPPATSVAQPPPLPTAIAASAPATFPTQTEPAPVKTSDSLSGTPFVALDYKPVRRRRSGPPWLLLMTVVCLLGAGVIGGVLYKSQLAAFFASLQDKSKDDGSNSDGRGDHPKDKMSRNGAARANPGDDLPVAVGPFPRRALIVHVCNYLFANPIHYGGRGQDGQALREKLASGIRIPTSQITELSDSGPQEVARPPIKAVIEQAIGDFLTTSRPQDRILLFFIGHAVELENEPYLVPIEGDLGDKDTLIPLSWLYEQLKACKARQKVLIMDVCRFNPGRGLERPGSGPMGEKLDAALQKPPDGVQVWSACVKGQDSYEFEDDVTNGGLFLNRLIDTLATGNKGVIQTPDLSLPIADLAPKVEAGVKELIGARGKEQTPRLVGKETEEGAAYDAKEPVADKLVIKKPADPEGGAAPLPLIRDILNELDVPPIKKTKIESGLKITALPAFSAKVMEKYKVADAEQPLRKATEKARMKLHEVVGKINDDDLSDYVFAPVNEMAFGAEILKREKVLAFKIHELEEAYIDLKKAGTQEQEQEVSKRAQADYDYIRARLAAQIAFLYEYESMLGSLRKGLPPRDVNLHTGWRMASKEKLDGDKAGRDMAKESRTILEKLAKKHPGTPWELLAKRDMQTALGLEWQATRIQK
jgi:hypothetical protein